MNKTQLIKQVNSKIEGQTIKSITEIVEAVIEQIRVELRANNKVSFQGFLTIENKLIKGRNGELAGHKWQTKDKLYPKAKIMKKFQKEIQDGKK